MLRALITILVGFTLTFLLASSQVFAQIESTTMTVPTAGLPIVELGPLLTFLIRFVFVVAGIAALFYALLGGLAWITSGGEKEEIQEARDKIQAAILGVFILILVLTILWTLETIIFRRAVCFGISCDIRIPSLDGSGTSPSGGGTSSGGGSSGGGTGSNIPRRDQFDALCREYCGFSRVGFRDGYCGNAQQDSCDHGGAYTNPEPASEDYRCSRGGEEGPCCCF